MKYVFGVLRMELDMAEALGITVRRKSDPWLHAAVHST